MLKKDDIKFVTSDKVVMPEKVSNSIQVFNSYFVDDIKDLYTNKVYEKSCQVLYIYNDEKKSLVLMHLLKILKVSQNIGFLPYCHHSRQ